MVTSAEEALSFSSPSLPPLSLVTFEFSTFHLPEFPAYFLLVWSEKWGSSVRKPHIVSSNLLTLHFYAKSPTKLVPSPLSRTYPSRHDSLLFKFIVFCCLLPPRSSPAPFHNLFRCNEIICSELHDVQCTLRASGRLSPLPSNQTAFPFRRVKDNSSNGPLTQLI